MNYNSGLLLFALTYVPEKQQSNFWGPKCVKLDVRSQLDVPHSRVFIHWSLPLQAPSHSPQGFSAVQQEVRSKKSDPSQFGPVPTFGVQSYSCWLFEIKISDCTLNFCTSLLECQQNIISDILLIFQQNKITAWTVSDCSNFLPHHLAVWQTVVQNTLQYKLKGLSLRSRSQIRKI